MRERDLLEVLWYMCIVYWNLLYVVKYAVNVSTRYLLSVKRSTTLKFLSPYALICIFMQEVFTSTYYKDMGRLYHILWSREAVFQPCFHCI